MSHEFELPDELNQLEATLKARKLSAATVDRDQLIYQAGFAAGRNSVNSVNSVFTSVITSPQQNDRHPAAASVSAGHWRNLSLALATLSAVLSLVIVRYELVSNTNQPIAAGAATTGDEKPVNSILTEPNSKLKQDVVEGLSTAQLPAQSRDPLALATDAHSNQETGGDLIRDRSESFTPRRSGLLTPAWLEHFFPSSSIATAPIRPSASIHRAMLLRGNDPADFLTPQYYRSRYQDVSFDDNDPLPPFSPARLRDLLDELSGGA